ncbi:hypothetical protein ABIF21_004407 [Bradyrhizobium elkanii]
MAVTVAEADDLVLDRGAIARSGALDLTGIHRRAMHIGPDHLMGRGRRPGDAALDLRRRNPVSHDRKRLRRLVSGLHFDRGPVDRSAVEARRRSGLEPAERKPCPFEGSRQAHGRRLADPARRPILLPEMDQTAQKGAGRDDNRTRRQPATIAQANAGHATIGDDQFIRLAFDDAEVRGLGDRRLHRRGVELAVSLGPGATDRRTLPAIEHAKLDAAGVGHPAHQTIQRVDFADQMALAEPPDGGIARHRANGRETMGHQGGLCTHPGRSARGFAAGMAAADDDDVK